MFAGTRGVALLPLAALLAVASACDDGSPTYRGVDLDRARVLRSEFEVIGGAVEQVSADELGEPTGWATLRGVFRINGDPPQPTQLNITKDQQVCAPGGGPVYRPRVAVGAGGGIANVLIYCTTPVPDDPAWIHESYASLPEEVEFDQRECVFLKPVVAMHVSQKLKVLNSDDVGHNAKMEPFGAKSYNQLIPAGGYDLYEPGAETRQPFGISCSIHPWMLAHGIVRSNPYFAVTDADGAFEIPNLPAGVPLEFRVWQESCGSSGFVSAGSDGGVTVNGEPADWDKGVVRFDANTLKDGAEIDFDVELDASLFQSG